VEASCSDLQRALAGEFSGDLETDTVCSDELDVPWDEVLRIKLSSATWPVGRYVVDVEQAAQAFECELELVELWSARTPGRDDAGMAGAAGASSGEQATRYVSARSCNILRNTMGGSSAPDFEFDAGVVVTLPNRDAVTLSVRYAGVQAFQHEISAPDDCRDP